MPRTVDEILAHADELADRFESAGFDGEQVGSAECELIAAARDWAKAEAQMVAAARRAGTSWAKIGKLIGTSGEAARQRYSPAG